MVVDINGNEAIVRSHHSSIYLLLSTVSIISFRTKIMMFVFGTWQQTTPSIFFSSISRCFPDIYVVLTIVGSWILELLDGYHNFLTNRSISYQQLLYYNGGGGSFIIYGELYVPLPLCLLSGVMMNEGWYKVWRHGRGSV